MTDKLLLPNDSNAFHSAQKDCSTAEDYRRGVGCSLSFQKLTCFENSSHIYFRLALNLTFFCLSLSVSAENIDKNTKYALSTFIRETLIERYGT